MTIDDILLELSAQERIRSEGHRFVREAQARELVAARRGPARRASRAMIAGLFAEIALWFDSAAAERIAARRT